MSVADRQPASGRGRVLVTVFSVITVGYLTWLVSSNFGQIDRALLRLRGAAFGWVIAAVLLEAFSQMCSVVVQHRLLKRAGAAFGFRTSARLVLAQNAIGSAVPGGTAAASMFSYRQIRRHGADGSAAAWVVATSSLVGMLALATFGVFTATGTSLLSVLVVTILIGAVAVLVLLIRAPRLLVDPTTTIVVSIKRHVVGPMRRSVSGTDRGSFRAAHRREAFLHRLVRRRKRGISRGGRRLRRVGLHQSHHDHVARSMFAERACGERCSPVRDVSHPVTQRTPCRVFGRSSSAVGAVPPGRHRSRRVGDDRDAHRGKDSGDTRVSGSAAVSDHQPVGCHRHRWSRMDHLATTNPIPATREVARASVLAAHDATTWFSSSGPQQHPARKPS